jgi:hypothetical protein
MTVMCHRQAWSWAWPGRARQPGSESPVAGLAAGVGPLAAAGLSGPGDSPALARQRLGQSDSRPPLSCRRTTIAVRVAPGPAALGLPRPDSTVSTRKLCRRCRRLPGLRLGLSVYLAGHFGTVTQAVTATRSESVTQRLSVRARVSLSINRDLPVTPVAVLSPGLSPTALTNWPRGALWGRTAVAAVPSRRSSGQQESGCLWHSICELAQHT